MTIDNFVGKSKAYLGQYPNERTAVIFIDEHNDDEIVATVNLPDVQLGTDEVIIKDYSENTGMYEAMLKRGYISPEIRRVESGFVDMPVVKLLVQQTDENKYLGR